MRSRDVCIVKYVVRYIPQRNSTSAGSIQSADVSGHCKVLYIWHLHSGECAYELVLNLLTQVFYDGDFSDEDVYEEEIPFDGSMSTLLGNSTGGGTLGSALTFAWVESLVNAAQDDELDNKQSSVYENVF